MVEEKDIYGRSSALVWYTTANGFPTHMLPENVKFVEGLTPKYFAHILTLASEGMLSNAEVQIEFFGEIENV